MKKYDVTICSKASYNLTIMSESEDQALRDAVKFMEGQDFYYNGISIGNFNFNITDTFVGEA